MAETEEPGAGDGDRSDPWYVRWVAALMASVVFILMAETFVDVIGRYLFSAPIPGGFEVRGLMLGIVIFSGMALITRDRGHICVGLFDQFFRGRVRKVQQYVIFFGTVVMVGFISERMWGEAEFYREDNILADHLDIPLAPLLYFLSFLALLTVVKAAARHAPGTAIPRRASPNGSRWATSRSRRAPSCWRP